MTYKYNYIKTSMYYAINLILFIHKLVKLLIILYIKHLSLNTFL